VASDVFFPVTRQTFWHRIKHYAVWRGSTAKSSPRTCYAMRSPRICSIMAPTCAWCRCC
jgi:hypothetical protein